MILSSDPTQWSYPVILSRESLQPSKMTALIGYQGFKHMSLWGKLHIQTTTSLWFLTGIIETWESLEFCCSDKLFQMLRVASRSLTRELHMAHSSQSFQGTSALWEVKLSWLMTEAQKWATSQHFQLLFGHKLSGPIAVTLNPSMVQENYLYSINHVF